MTERSLLVWGVTSPLKKSIQTELSTTINAASLTRLSEVSIERDLAKKFAHARLLSSLDQELEPRLDRCAFRGQTAQFDGLRN